MAYSVHYGDNKNVSAPISGYLLAQPFRFQGGSLVLDAINARLLVQLTLLHSSTNEYPSPTSALPLAGHVDIADSKGNKLVSVTDFRTEAIYSSQSFDVATTTWLLAGTAPSTLNFAPPEFLPPKQADRANHYPWRGQFDAGSGHKLQLSYLECSYGVAGGVRGVERLFAAGDANSNGIGNVFSFVTGSPPNQPLTAAAVTDRHRNIQLDFFGATDEAIAQMQVANGVVFALNGSFKSASPASLQALLHTILPKQPIDGGQPAPAVTGSITHPLWHGDPFEGRAQTLADTPTRVAQDLQYEVTGGEMEGIALWDMNPLPGDADALL